MASPTSAHHDHPPQLWQRGKHNTNDIFVVLNFPIDDSSRFRQGRHQQHPAHHVFD
jgi:hypothetical protein